MGCGLSPRTFDRGQSEAWSQCLRFLPKSTPEAEARTKKVRDGAGASLGGLEVRQGDQHGEVELLPMVAISSMQPQALSEQSFSGTWLAWVPQGQKAEQSWH